MLTKTWKSKVNVSRLTSLALLVVTAITLFAYGHSASGGISGGGGDKIILDEIILIPIVVTITTPPSNGGTQVIEYLDDGGGNGKYQNMEFDVSDVPAFNSIATTGRTYTARTSNPDVATVMVDSRTGMTTVDAKMQGSATITVTAEGPAAASSTLTRSVSAPATPKNISASYSFMVELENRGPTVENPIPDQTPN